MLYIVDNLMTSDTREKQSFSAKKTTHLNGANSFDFSHPSPFSSSSSFSFSQLRQEKEEERKRRRRGCGVFEELFTGYKMRVKVSV